MILLQDQKVEILVVKQLKSLETSNPRLCNVDLNSLSSIDLITTKFGYELRRSFFTSRKLSSSNCTEENQLERIPSTSILKNCLAL